MLFILQSEVNLAMLRQSQNEGSGDNFETQDTRISISVVGSGLS